MQVAGENERGQQDYENVHRSDGIVNPRCGIFRDGASRPEDAGVRRPGSHRRDFAWARRCGHSFGAEIRSGSGRPLSRGKWRRAVERRMARPRFRTRTARFAPDRKRSEGRQGREGARSLRRVGVRIDVGAQRCRRRRDGHERSRDSRRRCDAPVARAQGDRRDRVQVCANRQRGDGPRAARVRPRGIDDASDGATRLVPLLGRAAEPRVRNSGAHRAPLLSGLHLGRH